MWAATYGLRINKVDFPKLMIFMWVYILIDNGYYTGYIINWFLLLGPMDVIKNTDHPLIWPEYDFDPLEQIIILFFNTVYASTLYIMIPVNTSINLKLL